MIVNFLGMEQIFTKCLVVVHIKFFAVEHVITNFPIRAHIQTQNCMLWNT